MAILGLLAVFKPENISLTNTGGTLNWAVSDKNEAASILTKGADSSGPWRPQDLTSSGKFVQKIIREW